MTYEEALEYIHTVNWTFCKPGLERTRELCEKLGNPQDSLRFIHVAGTNGKGSFCSMLSSVLTQAGYKTGLYTSPYITVFNDRMRVDGENIPNETLARLTDKVRPVADAMTDKPTEFELITAIAFLYFKEVGCDVVVLETGMGGRLDSTNIIKDPLLSVITGIALDHTAFLGDSVEKIAREKAGIIKEGAPVLYGGEDESARRIIAEVAQTLGAPMSCVDYSKLTGHDYTLSGTTFSYKTYKNVKIGLLGGYQPRNAALVLDAIEILKSRGLEVSDNAVRGGLASAVWHARFEIISSEPLIIFDGAHNPQGIDAAVESVKLYFDDKVHVLTGVLRDKDYSYIVKRLSEIAECATTITPDNPRALDGAQYASLLCEHGVDAEAAESIESALAIAIKKAKASGRALVCLGSLYTYVDVIKCLKDK